MSGFNSIMLGLAGAAVLAFFLLLAMLAKRTRGQGFEPPDPRPRVHAPPPATHAPAPVPLAVPRPDYVAWRLIGRELANPDSAGGPLYRLNLEPEDELPAWRAGAVARIYCGPSQDVMEPGGSGASPDGDYMVGSLPAEGGIELVIRLRPGDGLVTGRRSHWLCEGLLTGQQVALALLDNPGFAPPPDEIPLILIGNATGIAGLQAHLKARASGTRNWLIFGDRNSADDRQLSATVSEWVSTGHLERCDLVFPGEGREQRRITDQIEDAKAPFLDWALAGGAVYVCGSKPMGEDVHAAMTRLLGGEVLEALAEAGLYRSFLY